MNGVPVCRRTIAPGKDAGMYAQRAPVSAAYIRSLKEPNSTSGGDFFIASRTAALSGFSPAWRLKASNAPAGFARLNDAAHSGLPTRRSMAEVFVVRKHRGQGAGRAAAQALIADEPGRWEIAVARANTGALAFWRKVAGACAAGPIEELDILSPDWDGPVLRFTAR